MLELRGLVEIHREYHQSPQGNSTLATKFTSPHPLKTKINLHYIDYNSSVRTSQKTMRLLSLGKQFLFIDRIIRNTQERQSTYNVTLRCVHATFVAVQQQ
jgi:hypothetical protein